MGFRGPKRAPRHRRPKHSAAAVQTRPAIDLCRHSHSVHRPGDPSLCVQCACAHPQPELPFPLLHGIEVRSSKRASSIDITLPVDRNPPRRQEPASPRPPPGRWPFFSPAPPISKHGGPYCPCDDLLFDRQEEPPTVQPTSILLPLRLAPPPPTSRHRRRDRPSLTDVVPSSSASPTQHSSPSPRLLLQLPSTVGTTRAPTRSPANHTSISPRIGIADVPPPPPESSTVARVRAWGSANPRNAVQGHTWCEACHHHALPRCRSRRSRRLPRSTSALKMRGAGTSSPPRPHRIPGGLECPSPTCDALPSVPHPLSPPLSSTSLLTPCLSSSQIPEDHRKRVARQVRELVNHTKQGPDPPPQSPSGTTGH